MFAAAVDEVFDASPSQGPQGRVDGVPNVRVDPLDPIPGWPVYRPNAGFFGHQHVIAKLAFAEDLNRSTGSQLGDYDLAQSCGLRILDVRVPAFPCSPQSLVSESSNPGQATAHLRDHAPTAHASR